MASSPRIRSAGVEAFEPNQPAQPMYAVYSARGTATREQQADEQQRVSVACDASVWAQLAQASHSQ